MKTAVEFYREELNALVSLKETKFKTETEIFEQALEMQKEHKIDFALTVYSEIVETDKDFVDVIKSMNL